MLSSSLGLARRTNGPEEQRGDGDRIRYAGDRQNGSASDGVSASRQTDDEGNDFQVGSQEETPTRRPASDAAMSSNAKSRRGWGWGWGRAPVSTLKTASSAIERTPPQATGQQAVAIPSNLELHYVTHNLIGMAQPRPKVIRSSQSLAGTSRSIDDQDFPETKVAGSDSEHSMNGDPVTAPKDSDRTPHRDNRSTTGRDVEFFEDVPTPKLPMADESLQSSNSLVSSRSGKNRGDNSSSTPGRKRRRPTVMTPLEGINGEDSPGLTKGEGGSNRQGGNCPTTLSTFLTQRHHNQYLCFNLTDFPADEGSLLLLNNQIVNISWTPYDLAKSESDKDETIDSVSSSVASLKSSARWPSTLSLIAILDLCHAIGAYQSLSPQNVACLYCHNGKARTGVATACYLKYSGKVSSSLDGFHLFCRRSKLDGTSAQSTGGVDVAELIPPSLLRLFRNFDDMIELRTWPNAHSLYLRAVTLQGVPVEDLPVLEIWDGAKGRIYSSHEEGIGETSGGKDADASCTSYETESLIGPPAQWAEDRGFYLVDKALSDEFTILCRFGGKYSGDAIDQTKVLFRYANHAGFLSWGPLKLMKGEVDMRRYIDGFDDDFALSLMFERDEGSGEVLTGSSRPHFVVEGPVAFYRGVEIINSRHSWTVLDTDVIDLMPAWACDLATRLSNRNMVLAKSMLYSDRMQKMIAASSSRSSQNRIASPYHQSDTPTPQILRRLYPSMGRKVEDNDEEETKMEENVNAVQSPKLRDDVSEDDPLLDFLDNLSLAGDGIIGVYDLDEDDPLSAYAHQILGHATLYESICTPHPGDIADVFGPTLENAEEIDDRSTESSTIGDHETFHHPMPRLPLHKWREQSRPYDAAKYDAPSGVPHSRAIPSSEISFPTPNRQQNVWSYIGSQYHDREDIAACLDLLSKVPQSEYRLQDLVHLLTESVKWGKADAIQELKARNALLVARMDVSGTQGLVQGVQSSEALPAPEADSRPPEQNDVGANDDAAVTDEAREETIAVDDAREEVLLKEEPEYQKYWKMLSAGLPKAAVQNTMQRDGKDPTILDLDPNKSLKSQNKQDSDKGKNGDDSPPLKEDEEYAKYFKMLGVGLPMGAVQNAMQRDGKDPTILELDPNKSLKSQRNEDKDEDDGPPLKEDEEYAKYFKMLGLGLPMGAVQNAMHRDGKDPTILDLDPNKSLKSQRNEDEDEDDGPPLKEDEEYAKYFKMLGVGLPMGAVQNAMHRDGKDPTILDLDPNKSLKSQRNEDKDEDDGPPLKEDEEYAKYFKMLGVGLPMGAVQNAMQRDGKDPTILDLDPNKSLKSQRRKSSDKKKNKTKKKTIKRKKIYWTPIDEKDVKKESLWSIISGTVNMAQLKYDASEFENLFTETMDPAEKKKKAAAKRGADSSGKPKKSVQVIEGKRGMNGGIILARLKISFDKIAKMVDLMENGDTFDATQLSALKEFLPTDDERKALQKYVDDASKKPETKEEVMADLCACEKYMVEMMGVRNAAGKFDCMLYKLQFDFRSQEIMDGVIKLNTACNEVQSSERFRKLLAIILTVGNQINTGGEGNLAAGFSLDALLKLDEAKAFDKKTSVLFYLVKLVKQNDASLLKISEDVAHVSQVEGLMIDSIHEDLKQMRRELDDVMNTAEEDAKSDSNEDDDEMTEMQKFAKDADEKVNEYLKTVENTKLNFGKVLLYFGEDEKMSSGDFFTTMNKFLTMLKRAIEGVEDMDRQKLKEEKRTAAQKAKEKLKAAAKKLAAEAREKKAKLKEEANEEENAPSNRDLLGKREKSVSKLEDEVATPKGVAIAAAESLKKRKDISAKHEEDGDSPKTSRDPKLNDGSDKGTPGRKGLAITAAEALKKRRERIAEHAEAGVLNLTPMSSRDRDSKIGVTAGDSVVGDEYGEEPGRKEFGNATAGGAMERNEIAADHVVAGVANYIPAKMNSNSVNIDRCESSSSISEGKRTESIEEHLVATSDIRPEDDGVDSSDSLEKDKKNKIDEVKEFLSGLKQEQAASEQDARKRIDKVEEFLSGLQQEQLDARSSLMSEMRSKRSVIVDETERISVEDINKIIEVQKDPWRGTNTDEVSNKITPSRIGREPGADIATKKLAQSISPLDPLARAALITRMQSKNDLPSAQSSAPPSRGEESLINFGDSSSNPRSSIHVEKPMASSASAGVEAEVAAILPRARADDATTIRETEPPSTNDSNPDSKRKNWIKKKKKKKKKKEN